MSTEYNFFPFLDSNGNGGAGTSSGLWTDWTFSSGNPLTLSLPSTLTIASVWIPNLTAVVSFYQGATVTGTPFYVTTGTGPEMVPIPPNTLQLTLAATSGTMEIFASSRVFDPSKWGPSSSTIASITVTAPIQSTGGENPTISLDTPLPIADGGTGTATPSLIPGTGIDITGSWPNQTVAVATASGVSEVTATVPITSTGGSTPNIGLITPLPIAYGGTSSTGPAGVESGTGTSVVGDFPFQIVNNTGVLELNSQAGVINILSPDGSIAVSSGTGYVSLEAVGGLVQSVAYNKGNGGNPSITLPGTSGNSYFCQVFYGLQQGGSESDLTIGLTVTSGTVTDYGTNANSSEAFFNAMGSIQLYATFDAVGGQSIGLTLTISGGTVLASPAQPWTVMAIRSA